jgi:hypothetical protein
VNTIAASDPNPMWGPHSAWQTHDYGPLTGITNECEAICQRPDGVAQAEVFKMAAALRKMPAAQVGMGQTADVRLHYPTGRLRINGSELGETSKAKKLG